MNNLNDKYGVYLFVAVLCKSHGGYMLQTFDVMHELVDKSAVVQSYLVHKEGVLLLGDDSSHLFDVIVERGRQRAVHRVQYLSGTVRYGGRGGGGGND